MLLEKEDKHAVTTACLCIHCPCHPYGDLYEGNFHGLLDRGNWTLAEYCLIGTAEFYNCRNFHFYNIFLFDAVVNNASFLSFSNYRAVIKDSQKIKRIQLCKFTIASNTSTLQILNSSYIFCLNICSLIGSSRHDALIVSQGEHVGCWHYVISLHGSSQGHVS